MGECRWPEREGQSPQLRSTTEEPGSTASWKPQEQRIPEGASPVPSNAEISEGRRQRADAGIGAGSREQSSAGSVKEMEVRLDCFKESLWDEEMAMMNKILNLETFLLREAHKPRHGLSGDACE